jgi:hypothetical protein
VAAGDFESDPKRSIVACRFSEQESPVRRCRKLGGWRCTRPADFQRLFPFASARRADRLDEVPRHSPCPIMRELVEQFTR